MRKLIILAVCPTLALAKTFSVECVDNYDSCGGKKASLTMDNLECDDFEEIMIDDAGLSQKWNWREGDVWGNDFRDNVSGEHEYSDDADIFYYSGHGVCGNPPVTGAAPGDRPTVCASNTPHAGFNTVRPATESLWGAQSHGDHKLRWLLLDASCSVTVVPDGTNSQIVNRLAKGWLPPFDGMHMVVGSHGDAKHDILDSEDRGEDFAEDLADGDTYTDAWMDDGTIDVQDGACAVTMAVAGSVATAKNRRDNESLFHSVSASGHNFLAYSFVCE